MDGQARFEVIVVVIMEFHLQGVIGHLRSLCCTVHLHTWTHSIQNSYTWPLSYFLSIAFCSHPHPRQKMAKDKKRKSVSVWFSISPCTRQTSQFGKIQQTDWMNVLWSGRHCKMFQDTQQIWFFCCNSIGPFVVLLFCLVYCILVLNCKMTK